MSFKVMSDIATPLISLVFLIISVKNKELENSDTRGQASKIHSMFDCFVHIMF